MEERAIISLGLLIAAMFLLQALLSVLQMRHFSKEFMKLRKRGRGACGRQAGGFTPEPSSCSSLTKTA